jgi:hypothetical protein
MEDLFSSCTRMRDILDNRGLGPPERLHELNLDLSAEELLSAERAFTYADLYAMLGDQEKFVWLTPYASVARDSAIGRFSWDELDGSRHVYFNADGKYMCAFARSPEHLSEICDVVLRLLAASVVHSVTLHNWNHRHGVSINTTSLAYLMEQCLSLKVLTLKYLGMDADHCRVLGAYSRSDLELNIDRCKLTSEGASALAEVLGRNQGPTKLEYCNVDNIVLADGLRGNSRLKRFEPDIPSCRDVAYRQVLAIAGALRENKGLVELNLNFNWVSDEMWNAICDSLKTHPTLEVLDLRVYHTIVPAVITSRLQAILDMMKVNTSIHTIRLLNRYTDHELYRESVIPFLETNRLRPRLLAIQKTRPIAYRTGVLGRALLSARADANKFWVLLSGNAEVVAFASTTATTTPATNLPTVARFCKFCHSEK